VPAGRTPRLRTGGSVRPVTAVSRTGTSGPAPGDERGPVQRDGIAVPGLTVADVTRQLTWRVLGPLKGRAKSVLDWAGLRGEPPKTFRDAGKAYFVTGGAVAHRVRRVAAEGARLPLNRELIAELSLAAAPGEDPVIRDRCAHLLGVRPIGRARPVTDAAHAADPHAERSDSSPDARQGRPTPPG